MGNAGDLLKHGLLAEFTEWWCRVSDRPIRFLDPFGGRPWVEPPVPTVVERLKALSGSALSAAQPHPEMRYYGSAHIVRHAADAAGSLADVLVSDRDPLALDDLVRSGLRKLKHPGFDPGDGYSILRTEIDADLILIDPFDGFLSNEAPTILLEISKMRRDIAIIVFVLIRNPSSADGTRYIALKTQHLPHAWTLCCPPLQNTAVRGEKNYTAELLLVAPQLLTQPAAEQLKQQLAGYSGHLTKVLAAPVTFSQHSS